MLNNDDKTFEECGIKDNDMLLLELKESMSPSHQPTGTWYTTDE